MQIILNGQPRNISKIATVQGLLDELQLTGRLAVEINAQIVPRSLFQSHKINAGDVIEIVRAIGGG